MYIRRTSIKSRQTGEPYFTYRLVESIRSDGKVRQKTLLNLGRSFDLAREQWGQLSQRIEQIVSGQSDLLNSELDAQCEEMAQSCAAQLLNAQSRQSADDSAADYQTVDMASLQLLRPRSVGVEHVALSAVRQTGLDTQLKSLGFNLSQTHAALANIIARMVHPSSELATHQWLQQRSALDELLGCDLSKMSHMQLYRASDKLYANKPQLESFLYQQATDLFQLDHLITLYDLTNTYFEGTAKINSNASYGRSKEKRSDCPLVTLALVLDSSGFVKKSEVMAGNASEPKTLEVMINALKPEQNAQGCTIVLDAGIATGENITWLKNNNFRYVVVSRKRQRQFNKKHAQVIKETENNKISVQRIACPDTDEIELYCHSEQRENKDNAINELFTQRFETALDRLASGLLKKRAVKKYDRIIERIGRLKQKYSKAAQYYDITVDSDAGKATGIHWTRIKPNKDLLPGVYCLRTNQSQWDDETVWRTYTMLTDLEAVFRSLKSELGLRPVFHHKTDRVSGHLFISVLAYHLVHTLRYQLKAKGIHLSWEGLRRQLSGQDRITVQLKREDGKTLHIRKTTRAEQRQQTICDALGIKANPGSTQKTVIN